MTEHLTVHKMMCPFCGQKMLNERFGIPLSPLKAKLLDLVRKAGPAGITVEALLGRLPIAGSRERRPATLNVHINQLNDLIDASGYRIIGSRRAGGEGNGEVHSARKYLVQSSKKALP